MRGNTSPAPPVGSAPRGGVLNPKRATPFNKNINEVIKKEIKSLIIPYTILYILSFLAWVPSRVMWHKELFENNSILKVLLLKPFLGMLIGVGYDTNYSTMMNIPLWFLVGLFFVKIIHNIITKLVNNNRKIYIVVNIFIILFTWFLKMLSIDLWFSIDSALLALPFFSLGYLLKNNMSKTILKIFYRNKVKILFYKILILITAFFSIIFLSRINGRVDINSFNYGRNIILFYITGTIGIFMVIIISNMFIKEAGLIRTISSGTILILAYHGYVSAPIVRIMGMYSKELSILTAIPISIISTLIMFFPIVIARKYFPAIVGGRK
jgi:fucose 4-O-acetylase-like acetyltransferase